MKNCEVCGKAYEEWLPSSRFCSLKCNAVVNPPPRPIPKPLADRFWPKVDKSAGPDACWPWTGSADECGYGMVHTTNRRAENTTTNHVQRAHRVALKLSGIDIPPGMLVLHKCDNPPCCNPSHLYVGTYQQNTDDREQRDRSNRLRGERHGRAKLTDEIVRLIQSQSFCRGEQRRLAETLGVSEAVISSIKHRRSWRHVT